MLNMIKMELYRMVHAKSFYIILLVCGLMTFSSIYLMKEDVEMSNENSQVQETVEDAQGEAKDSGLVVAGEVPETEDEPVNIGMTVALDTTAQQGDKIPYEDMFSTMLSSSFSAMFLVIFVVIFVNADNKNGYIKNIAGQIDHRSWMVFSKVVCVAVYTLFVMLVTALAGALGSRMAFGYVYIKEFSDPLSYLGSQYLLHFALAMIILCVTMVLRSSAISMTIAVCLCMNISSLLYALVDKLVAKCGVKDFHLSEYVVTGNISLLPAAWDSKMYIRAIVVALCFAAVSVAIGSITVKKRDIA